MREKASSRGLPRVPVILAGATMMFAAMALLAFVWASTSPVLGRVYAGIRIAESAGLWLLTDWGRYFTGVPKGEPFAFLSIFQSSVPFGALAGFATAVIGLLAYRKRSTRHLDAVLAAPAGFSTATILQDLRTVLPHVSVRARPAEDDTVAPVATQPSSNPFAALRDMRNGVSVSVVVPELAWFEVATFAVLIDAIAPLADRTRHTAVLKAAWRTVCQDRADGRVVPSKVDLGTIQAILTQTMSDLVERDVRALELAHRAAATAGTTHDALVALARLAQSDGRSAVTDLAWLRYANPLLHAFVVSRD